MSKKLYIGNLDYGVTKDDLLDLFSKAGKVIDAVVISDKYSGRSKGFGFVEYEKDEEATKGIEMYNEKEYKGRNMVVNEARPPKPRDDR